MIKTKDNRPLRTKIYYYFMVIAGPLTVFISSGGVTIFVYKSAISSLFLTDSTFSIFIGSLLTISIFLSWILGNSILIYSAVINPGTTEYVLNSKEYQQKYSMFLSPEFLSTLPKCDKCGLPKPPRCHHCSTCGKCHLKLDHHCLIIGKCVALRNQQPFYVACHWATLSVFFDVVILTFVIAFSLLLKGIYKVKSNFMNNDVKSILNSDISFIDSFLIKTKSELIFLFVLDCLSLVLFLLFYSFICDSYQKVKQNSTTFELIFPIKNMNWNPYDLGIEDNLFQVYGSRKLKFLTPKIADMCGFEWATPEYAIQNFDSNAFIDDDSQQDQDNLFFQTV